MLSLIKFTYNVNNNNRIYYFNIIILLKKYMVRVKNNYNFS